MYHHFFLRLFSQLLAKVQNLLFYVMLQDEGEGLIKKKHFASKEIGEAMEQLDRGWEDLSTSWDERKQLLTQCYDLRVN